MMATPEEKPRPRQARELARRLGLLTQAQAAAGWAVIIILAALLGVIYLNQTSKIATIGRRVQREQADLDEIKRQNAELEQRIAVIPDYPSEPAADVIVETADEARPTPPGALWEAIALTFRDLGIDLTRGEVNEQ